MVAINADAAIKRRSTFSIGGVIAKATSIYMRNFISFSILAGLVVAINEAVMKGINTPLLAKAGLTSQVEIASVAVLGVVLMLALYMVVNAIILHGVFQRLRSGMVRIGTAIARGLNRAPAMVLLGFVWLFGIVGSSALLAAILGGGTSAVMARYFPLSGSPEEVWQTAPLEFWPVGVAILIAFIPSLFLTVAWEVSTGACVAEGLGALKSLGRSRKLTKSYRGRLFMLVLFLVLVAAIPGIATLVLGAAAETMPFLAVVLTLQVFSTAYSMTLPGVIYHDLRLAREGDDIGKMATVFD